MEEEWSSWSEEESSSNTESPAPVRAEERLGPSAQGPHPPVMAISTQKRPLASLVPRHFPKDLYYWKSDL